MANTYTLIEKIVVGAAGASDVTFTSIPQTYTDLMIFSSARTNRSSSYRDLIQLRPNAATTNLSARALTNDSGTVSSGTATVINGGMATASSSTASTFGNSYCYIPNYAGSTNKSFSTDATTEDNSTNIYQTLEAGLWSNTAAITSIQLVPNVGTLFTQNSSFYLYGIAKEGVTPSPSSAPYATGGDRIVFDGTYWYHVFTSTGTFTPQKGLTADCLVIAGGGSGGTAFSGGGGGAGGLCQQNGRSLASGTNYSVTIGAGGARLTTDGTSNGSNSTFGAITANGGGGGGYNASSNGASGGSGGGGRFSATAGGAATQGNSDGATGYGNAGGFYSVTSPSGNAPSSGGGGAGAVGGSPTSTSNNGAAGGAGLNTWSSWASATSTGVSGYYAGGGGGGVYYGGAGGAGGAGGGGAGPVNNSSSGSAGVANTGSGGGGSAGYDGGNYGGSGGSGIVIVRYAA